MGNKNKITPKKPKQPVTIEELKLWYAWHNLPAEEVTRFFIGRNITEPKAFGIYKNEQGECVVYKNKMNGERAVRYQGTDEAFAVGELLQRLKDEIASQKAKKPFNAVVSSARGDLPSARGDLQSPVSAKGDLQSPQQREARKGRMQPAKSSSGESKKENGIIAAIVGIMVAAVMFLSGNHAPNGYYYYQGQHYYRQGTSWYLYKNTTRDWYQTKSLESEITKDNADQYRITRFDGSRFEDSRWYDDGSDDSSGDDDDYWNDDDDSWDSRDTDWDSDW